jgi:curved DNA-binding protein
MDYYSILGVPKNASQEEIKKAYKKACMKHHPDRGGDEALFKQINEAYATLGDAQKRAAYDNPQPHIDSSYFRGNPQGFEDIFAQAFGFGGPRRRQARNRDVRINYTISFKEVFTGAAASLAVKLPSGRQEVLDIHIPKGVKNGDTVNLAGYGDDSLKGIPRGNLFINIKVISDPNWRRDGDNIYCEKKINIFEIILGTKINITTPTNNTISLNVPQGTRPGTTFSVPGHGAPNVNTNKPGNLYVKIDGIVPKIKDTKLLTMIEELKDATA